MRLYLLTNDEPKGYDITLGMVVRATDGKQARELASRSAGDEGAEVWTTSKRSSIVLLARNAPGRADVVLRDFLRG